MKPSEPKDEPAVPAGAAPVDAAQADTEVAADASPAPVEQKPSLARRVRRYALEGALVVGVFLTVSHLQTQKLVPEDSPAPELVLRDLEGKTVRLADLQGKRVLIHFWATWCGVCQHEVGALNATQASLGPDEVLLTVVADGDNKAAVKKFVSERGAKYPVLLGNDEIVRRFHVSMFPTSYYVNPEGVVDAATVGMSTRWSMQARLGCAR